MQGRWRRGRDFPKAKHNAGWSDCFNMSCDRAQSNDACSQLITGAHLEYVDEVAGSSLAQFNGGVLYF
jgi:hypothetical protein